MSLQYNDKDLVYGFSIQPYCTVIFLYIRMLSCLTQKKTQTVQPGCKHTVDAELANTHNTITNVPQIDTDNALQEKHYFPEQQRGKTTVKVFLECAKVQVCFCCSLCLIQSLGGWVDACTLKRCLKKQTNCEFITCEKGELKSSVY